jgi:hypothetical protein
MNVLVLLGKKLGIYLAAVFTAYLLAVAAATQHVAGRLAAMGVEVDISQRLAMTASDLFGMAGMFLPIIAFGLLIAFLVTALLCRWLPRWRTPLYVLAGASALLCIHVALHQAFGLTPIPAARTMAGLFLQGLAGAAGGFVYITLNLRAFHDSPFAIAE